MVHSDLRFGKIKRMMNDAGEFVSSALPSMPVRLIGFRTGTSEGSDGCEHSCTSAAGS